MDTMKGRLWMLLGAGVAMACGGAEETTPGTTAASVASPAAAPEPAAPAAPAAHAAAAEPGPEPVYVPGKWVWHELVTKDANKASEFYAEVFDWTIEETEMGGETFLTIKNGDHEIGLIVEKPQVERPQWMGYVSVPNVDAAVAAAREAGAKEIETEPTDIPNIGRFAHIVDPKGALFGVFKSLRGDAPDHPPGEGDFSWDELWVRRSKDRPDAVTFYGATVGYTERPFDEGKEPYLMFVHGEAPRAGVTKALRGNLASLWVPYVVVEDVDDTVDTAKEAGARVIGKPANVKGVGRFAVIQDPVKGVIGVITPETAAAEEP